MGMPVIRPSNAKRCQVISDVIESVALEETALSHILNAEGEKIQKVIGLARNVEEMIKVNDSVQSMVDAITRLEVILKGKLELFKECLCDECRRFSQETMNEEESNEE